MKSINIHENKISITIDDDVLYVDTLDNFELDSKMKIESPQLPWTGKLYIKDNYVRHFNKHTESTEVKSWLQGDVILVSINNIISNKETRIEQLRLEQIRKEQEEQAKIKEAAELLDKLALEELMKQAESNTNSTEPQ